MRRPTALPRTRLHAYAEFQHHHSSFRRPNTSVSKESPTENSQKSNYKHHHFRQNYTTILHPNAVKRPTAPLDVRIPPFPKEFPLKSQKIANFRPTFEPRYYKPPFQTRPRTFTQQHHTTDSTATEIQQQPSSFRKASTPKSINFRRKSAELPISHPFPTQTSS